MVDQTIKFHEYINGCNGSKIDIQPTTTKNLFHLTTCSLLIEISSLKDQVRLFRLEHARTSMNSSVTRSGAAISSGAERLKRKFEDLEKALKAIHDSLNSSSTWTTQGRQHAEKVIKSMELNLGAIAKDFRETLEKRAKALAGRQARQKEIFGEVPTYIHPPQPLMNKNNNNNDYEQQQQYTTYSKGVRHRQPLFNNDPQQQQQTEQVMVRKRDQMEFKASTKDVEKVEQTIGELTQMFYRVAGMVQEHGEILKDVENQTDDTVMYTNTAQLELLKLFRFVSGDRALIIKILVTVLIVGMVMIYFWT